MKAVVAALVLIVGAAVVLWYGNTLNSWVLGGLIGGLAALLLSIPISLTIFSFLSRHHDQRLRTDEEEYEPAYEYPELPERAARSFYVVEEDRPRTHREIWGEEEEWYEEEEDDEEDFYGRTQGARRLPAAQPRLPAPGQQRPSQRLPSPQRGTLSSKQLPATSRQLPERSALNTRQLSPREKDITGRKPPLQRMNYPGHPGYQAEGQQSQFRSQALRTARLEAARRREEDEIEELPSYRPKRSSIIRSSRVLSEPQDAEQEVLPQTQQGVKQYPRHPRRIVEASQTRNGESRSLSQAGESTTWQPLQRQQAEPKADVPGPSTTNSDLKRSLVRRAPYMYEDDPLRKQLSQQVDGPITRRSSRNLAAQQEEE